MGKSEQAAMSIPLNFKRNLSSYSPTLKATDLMPETNASICTRTKLKTETQPTERVVLTVPDVGSSKHINQIKKELKIGDFVLAVVSAAIVTFAVVEEDYFFESDYESSYESKTLRSVVSLLILVSVLVLVRRYIYVLRLMKAEDRADSFDNFLSTGLYKSFLLELGINCIHCPVGLDTTFTVEQSNFSMIYSANMILTCFCLLRVYTFVRALGHLVSSDALEKTLKWHRISDLTSFKVKVFLTDRPVLGAVMSFISCLISFAVLVMLIEE
jgi:uncharacterized membrane protein YidH (DUF202 family)